MSPGAPPTTSTDADFVSSALCAGRARGCPSSQARRARRGVVGPMSAGRARRRELPRRDDVADLRAWSATVTGRRTAVPATSPSSRHRRRGQVDREPAPPRVRLRDQLGGICPRLAVEPRAEQPVEDDVAVEPFGSLLAGRAQRSSAIRRRRRWRRLRTPRRTSARPGNGAAPLGNRPAGLLHEHADVVPRLRALSRPPCRAVLAHLAPDAMAMAAASSFECVIERSTSPPSRAACRSSRPRRHARLRPAGDLDLPPGECPGHAEPERLAHGLFAGKSRRVVLRGLGASRSTPAPPP